MVSVGQKFRRSWAWGLGQLQSGGSWGWVISRPPHFTWSWDGGAAGGLWEQPEAWRSCQGRGAAGNLKELLGQRSSWSWRSSQGRGAAGAGHLPMASPEWHLGGWMLYSAAKACVLRGQWTSAPFVAWLQWLWHRFFLIISARRELVRPAMVKEGGLDSAFV